jgi:hypothetical protein
MTSDDYTQDPEYIAWAKEVRKTLIPKMADSDAIISLVPTGQPDVKFSVELGLSIMLDKPIVVAVQPGAKIPPKLAKIADAIVEVDMDNPASAQRRIGEAVQRIMILRKMK